MASRQVAIYFAWSRSDEDHAQLGTLENRFTTLFEARRLQWPRLEHLADPTRFDQGITGFLDHLLLANFGMFADLAGTLTGNHARRAQRRNDTTHTALNGEWLTGVDTLVIISWDSNRSNQRTTPEEIHEVRTFLDKPGQTVFVCPHHDIGDIENLSAEEGRRRQEAELHHHGDLAIPSQQRFGTFGLSLLEGLGIPIKNRFGLRPAKTTDGNPAPLRVSTSADRFGVMSGVTTFNLHPHLPHFEMLGSSPSKLDVLARQAIDPTASPHPFAQGGRGDFDALLQTKPETFAGQLFISDPTIWMSTAGGLESLQRFWRNVLEIPLH